MSLNTLLGILPWLALLACPLMMGWMMRGMRGSGGRGCGGHADPRDAEIRALKARLERLEGTGAPEEPADSRRAVR